MKKNVLYAIIVCMAALLTLSSCKKDDVPMYDRIKIACDFSNVDPTGMDDLLVAVVASPGVAWEISNDISSTSWFKFLDQTYGDGTMLIRCKVDRNVTGITRNVVLTLKPLDIDYPVQTLTISQKTVE